MGRAMWGGETKLVESGAERFTGQARGYKKKRGGKEG